MELANPLPSDRFKIDSRHIPFILLLVFLNIYKSILYYFGFNWLPLGFSVLILFSLLFARLFSKNHFLEIHPLLQIYIVWALFQLLFPMITGGAMISLVGFTSLYLNFFLWTLLLNRRDSEALFYAFLKIIFFLGILMAFFSIYQYFLDYELFVKPHSLYANIEALEAQSHITRRSTSFIGSPQNLGFYLIMVFPLTNLFLKRSLHRLISKAIVLGGGFLSGSATFGGGLIVLWMIHEIDRKRKRTLIIILLMLVFLFVLTGDPFKKDAAYLNSLSLGFASHFSYYEKYFQDISPVQFLFGHGLGYADRLTERYFVDRPDAGWMPSSESFILRIYYEVGVIGIVLYALIVSSSLQFLRRDRYRSFPKPLFAICVLIIVNAVFTPVQSGITGSFLSWPFLIYPFAFRKDRNDGTKTCLSV